VAVTSRLRPPHPATGSGRLAASVALFAATFLAFVGVGATLPVLPQYVSGPLGGGDISVGIVAGAFAFSAIVARPWGGRMADSRGRRAVMAGGLVLVGLGSSLYLVSLGIAGLVLARLVIGVGDGFVHTAGATWIVDLAPESRRGQAIGLFGLAIWSGLAVGPVTGELLLDELGYDAVWILAAVTPLAGALVARRVPDAHRPAPRTERGPLVPREAVRPGIALALVNTGYAAMAGFVVLMLADRGVGSGAAVFTVFAVALIASRLLAGRLPDRVGARRVAVGAALAGAAGMAVLALSQSLAAAVAGAMVLGIGSSLIYPSLALIVVSRTPDERRGAALGAFTAFFDLGVGLGAPLAGVVAALAGYGAAFWVAAGCGVAAAVVTALGAGPRRGRVPADPELAFPEG